MSSLTLEKEKSQSQLKNQNNELSKSLTLNNLPILSSPLHWLNWFDKYKTLAQNFTTDIAKQSLIRSSLTKQLDKLRIDSCQNSKQMLEYLMKTYGDSELFLPATFNKLKNMPT